MLPRNQPDRIRIVFDDHAAWWPMPVCSCLATLARHLGLRGTRPTITLTGAMRAGAGQHRETS